MMLVHSPQIKLPSSKTTTADKKTHLMLACLKALPQRETKPARVRRKPEPYHPTWSRLWNSRVILGMAVAMILCDGMWC